MGSKMLWLKSRWTFKQSRPNPEQPKPLPSWRGLGFAVRFGPPFYLGLASFTGTDVDFQMASNKKNKKIRLDTKHQLRNIKTRHNCWCLISLSRSPSGEAHPPQCPPGWHHECQGRSPQSSGEMATKDLLCNDKAVSCYEFLANWSKPKPKLIHNTYIQCSCLQSIRNFLGT